MSAFFITLIAVLLAGSGARDQIDIAGLTSRQGRRPSVLVVAIACAVATAVFAAWAATVFSTMLPPPARIWFVAIALGLAGGESLLLTPKPVPSEPTHSLGALALLLLAHQVTDAARFIVFGIAAGMAAPVVAGMAGALGGGVLVAAGWASPKAVTSRTARMARKLVGALLLLTAIVIALHERGIL
jgi:Ca2+/H+ antiporter, TMEM165/GDT1 family